MSDFVDATMSNAVVIESVDGLVMMFLQSRYERMKDRNIARREAASICREIENHIERAIRKGGKQYLSMAIPPELELIVTQGKRVEMQRTADNRVRMEVMANRAGQGLLLPGRDFKLT
jgi:hypothetical protein